MAQLKIDWTINGAEEIALSLDIDWEAPVT